MPNAKFFIAAAAAVAMLLPSTASLAQTKTQTPPAQNQAPAKPSPQKVTGPQISMLVRTTLVALHQANITGNYTVLRDLGATSFQRINTPVRLGQIFTRVRQARLDLSPAVMIDSIMTKKPVIDGNGLLQLEGRVPSQPLNIIFKMAFRFEGNRWRIFALAVGAQQPQAVAQKKPDPTAQKKAPASGKGNAAKPKTTTEP